jgi:hypothetical protein
MKNARWNGTKRIHLELAGRVREVQCYPDTPSNRHDTIQKTPPAILCVRHHFVEPDQDG